MYSFAARVDRGQLVVKVGDGEQCRAALMALQCRPQDVALCQWRLAQQIGARRPPSPPRRHKTASSRPARACDVGRLSLSSLNISRTMARCSGVAPPARKSGLVHYIEQARAFLARPPYKSHRGEQGRRIYRDPSVCSRSRRQSASAPTPAPPRPWPGRSPGNLRPGLRRSAASTLASLYALANMAFSTRRMPSCDSAPVRVIMPPRSALGITSEIKPRINGRFSAENTSLPRIWAN